MATQRPLRADAERNRRRILEAAVEVIGRRGVDAPVEEIARLAGVGRGTLYRRFPTKEELVRSIIMDRTERAVAEMQAAASEPDPWAALAGVLHALAAHLATERGLFDILTRGGRPIDVVPQRPDLFLAVVEPALGRARRAGAARSDVAAADLITLTAAVSQIGPDVRDRLWERYLEIVLAGVRAGAHAAPLPHAAPARPPRIR